jgi:glyoxylase-like metal-dependent hydrolase (beta-lactamase superfamily II)
MIAAPGHDATMLCAYDSRDKVLFSSDAIQGLGVTSKQFPSLPLYEDVNAYLASMKKLGKVNFEHLIPGHPFAPYTKQTLNRREGLDLLDQSVKVVARLEKTVPDCLEEAGKPLDLPTVTARVQKKLMKGSLTAQALCTVSAHLQKLISEGRVSLTHIGNEKRYAVQ